MFSLGHYLLKYTALCVFGSFFINLGAQLDLRQWALNWLREHFGISIWNLNTLIRDHDWWYLFKGVSIATGYNWTWKWNRGIKNDFQMNIMKAWARGSLPVLSENWRESKNLDVNFCWKFPPHQIMQKLIPMHENFRIQNIEIFRLSQCFIIGGLDYCQGAARKVFILFTIQSLYRAAWGRDRAAKKAIWDGWVGWREGHLFILLGCSVYTYSTTQTDSARVETEISACMKGGREFLSSDVNMICLV